MLFNGSMEMLVGSDRVLVISEKLFTRIVRPSLRSVKLTLMVIPFDR
jgi:hypothetical protein